MGEGLAPTPEPVDSQTPRAAAGSSSNLQNRQHKATSGYDPQPVNSSQSPPLVHQQRLKDAVNTAFDQTPTTDQLDPDFLKRLTEHVTDQVIRNLQAVNIGAPTPPPPFPSLPSFSAQPTSWSPSTRSPLRSSTDSFPPQFTPPSPHQERYERDVSPGRAPSEDGSTYSKGSSTGHNIFATTQSDKEAAYPIPNHGAIPVLRRSKTTAADESIPLSKISKKVSSDRDGPSGGVEFESPSFEQPARARPVFYSEDTAEPTTLEKIWQPLFVDGIPTLRLGQFLRGLAKHIVDDYEPRHSIVITPTKMLHFLNVTKTSDEHYPWSTIFGGQLCGNSISVMYRKLLCQHHFVQVQVHESPALPGLTPLGFETFMTCLIQAHPNSEFERLAIAVKEMPISNADDHRERFPKELSRRLLPARPNIPAEQRIISSLAHEPVLVPLERGISAMPPPPSSAPPLQNFAAERERNPYTQASAAVEDGDLTPPCVQLERERKPYSAKEGTGRRYNTDGDHGRDRDREREDVERSRDINRNTYRTDRPEYTSRPLPRRNSGALPQAMYNRNATADSAQMQPPNRKRMSTGAVHPRPPQNNPSYSKASRRSPPPGRSFARNDAMDVDNIPQFQHAVNVHPGQSRDRRPGPADGDGDVQRYGVRRANERNMNYTIDDDPNGRPIPPRNVTGSSGYTRNVPDGSPPKNSFPKTFTGTEERRRNWYPGIGPGGDLGGNDGYGPAMYGSSAQS